MKVDDSVHRLRLGDLVLSDGGDDRPNGDVDYTFKVYGADFSTGDSVPLNVTMRSLLQDGARVVTQGYGNREDAGFYVVVGGPDSAAVAEGELALALELGRRNELGWTPPDGVSPESVFDVETSHMVQGHPSEDDDLVEIRDGERVYRVTLVTQPFARTAEPETIPAVITDPLEALDETPLDAGSSPALWSARIGTLVDSGAFLSIQGSKTPRAVWTPAAPVALAGKRFITLVTRGGSAPYCDVNTGVRATLVASRPAHLPDGSNATRWFWETAETTVTKLEFGSDFSTYFVFSFMDLRARNIPVLIGTTRQSARSLAVRGSARTQGSLAVAGSQGLGSTIVYTNPGERAGFVALREFRTGTSGAAAVAGAVSGETEQWTTPNTYEVPASLLPPGRWQAVVRMKNVGIAGDFEATLTAQIHIDGDAVGPTVDTKSVLNNTGDNATFDVHAIGSMILPPAYLPETTEAAVEFELSTSGTSSTWDEVWLVNLDIGAITIVEAGDHTRVWVETETIARPYPVVLVGDAEDQSDAYADDARILGRSGPHIFGPGTNQALIVTGDCEAAETSFSFHPRFLTYVTRPD